MAGIHGVSLLPDPWVIYSRRATSCAPTGPTMPAQGNALGLADDKEWSPEGAAQGGALIPDISFIEINSVSHQEGSVFVLE